MRQPVAPGGLALHSAAGRVALAATVAASAMASLDATVVNVALPSIGRSFHVGVSSLQWLLTGYLLTLASLILLGGALGDRFGRRRIFIIGTAWFAAASLLCGIAPGIDVLIAARLVQGVGGALLTPGSLAILQASFRESDRGAAVGAWSGLGGIAGAIGPFVGGALIQGPGWRWVFLLNVPLAGFALIATRLAVPESRDEGANARIDLVGSALTAGTLALITWSSTEAGRVGWSDTAVLVAAAGAVMLLAGLVAHQRRADDPLIPHSLVRNRTFVVVNGGTVLLYGAVGLVFFLVAYELQVSAGWSPLKAGVALLPATLLMLLLSARSGAVAQRYGPRWQLLIGPLTTGAGLLLLTRIGPNTDWWRQVLPGSIVLGVGLVTFVAPLTATVMAAADPDHVGIASAANNAVARSASLLALAVVPVLARLPRAVGPAQVTHAYRISMVTAGLLAAAAGPMMFAGLSIRTRGARGDRRTFCPVDGPPLQCPVATGPGARG